MEASRGLSCGAASDRRVFPPLHHLQVGGGGDEPTVDGAGSLYHQLRDCLLGPVPGEPQALPYSYARRGEESSFRDSDLRCARDTPQAASDASRNPPENSGRRGSGAAPFSPLARLSSPRSRRRPLSSTTNSGGGPSPCPALTHVLLEGVSGEQRHLAVPEP